MLLSARTSNWIIAVEIFTSEAQAIRLMFSKSYFIFMYYK